MACIVVGQRSWKCSRDEIGYRNYRIKFLVRGTTLDGPANALQAAGLPTFGSMWAIGNDVDAWAFCHWDAEVTQLIENEPNNYFEVDILFSTKPPKFWCHEFPLTDYTLEPPKISGSFIRYTREYTVDRYGRSLTNSAHEIMRGPQVEFDDNRPQIMIEQNVASAYMAYILPSKLVNSVNIYPIWGFPSRCVKLCDVSWELRYWGVCFAYYMRRLVFDVRYPTEVDPGFDRFIGDEGTKVLSGHWSANGLWVLDNINGQPPNPKDPTHFIAYIDNKGNRARTPLNGAGLPAQSITGTLGQFISVQPNNKNHALNDPLWWIPVEIDDVADIEQWEGGGPFEVGYKYGDLVWVPNVHNPGDSVIFVCTDDGPIDSYPPATPASWVELGLRGTTNNQPLFSFPNNAGNYLTTTKYNLGDYVKDITKTGAGYHRVEVYPGADFTTLGIPLAF